MTSDAAVLVAHDLRAPCPTPLILRPIYVNQDIAAYSITQPR